MSKGCHLLPWASGGSVFSSDDEAFWPLVLSWRQLHLESCTLSARLKGLLYCPWFLFNSPCFFFKDICCFKNFCETFSCFLLVLLRFIHYNILFRKIYRSISLFICFLVYGGHAVLGHVWRSEDNMWKSLLSLRSLSGDSNLSCWAW